MHTLDHIDTALIVEDDYLIVLDIMETLQRLGVASTRVSGTCADGIEAVQNDIQFATLDIKLGDQVCYEVAEKLTAAGVPFIYISGYEPRDHPGLPPAPWVRKPAGERELLAAAELSLAGHT